MNGPLGGNRFETNFIHIKFDCLFLHRYRSFCEETAIPLDWPVEVNYHEAKAYAAWKGPDYRLPTESEHNAMRDQQVLLPSLPQLMLI